MDASAVCELPPRFDSKQTEMGDSCFMTTSFTLLHSFAEGGPVFGVQSIDKEIFIIRQSNPHIEVYDRSTFQSIRNISNVKFDGSYDMVQSRRNDSAAVSLLIANWNNAEKLTAVELPCETVTQWSFQEKQMTTLGLAGSSFVNEAIDNEANILVTSSKTQQIKEFTPDGHLVREVSLPHISSPRQSIKVDGNCYAVCHGYGPPPELHRVCLVDENGGIIQSYGGHRGSGERQLNIPARLELNKRKCILVADQGNKRVVLLDQNLEYVRDLINEGLEGPYRLYLDEEERRLYVADNTVEGIAKEGRVHVFKF